MESCWGSLKTEVIPHRRFATRDEAQREITEHIEIFYNRNRQQAGLGHLSRCCVYAKALWKNWVHCASPGKAQ